MAANIFGSARILIIPGAVNQSCCRHSPVYRHRFGAPFDGCRHGAWLPSPTRHSRKQLQRIVAAYDGDLNANSGSGLGSSSGAGPNGPPSDTTTATTAAAGAGPSSEQQQHSPPQRGRPTLDQMQREARSKLGDMVRQQLEADRQQQQQQRQQQQGQPGPSSSSSTDSSLSSSGLVDIAPSSSTTATKAGGRAAVSAATARSTAVDDPRPRPASAVASSAGATAPAAAASAAAGETGTASNSNSISDDWDDDWRRVRERWRQFIEHPLDPPPKPQRQDRPGGSVAEAAAGSGTESQQRPGEPKRRAVVSRALQLACVAVFAAQWAPVVTVVMGATPVAAAADAAAAATTGLKELWLALLLACPPTPVTLSWQADAVSLAAGNWGCLLSSSLLHSGLLSLAVSVASLGETAPWLESLDGFMIMLISYSMAGGMAALAQLCVGGQAAGISGLGAALGLEVAVAVRCVRYTAGQTMAPTLAGVALAAVAALLAAYQPLVGTWGILGGILGGALSAILAYDVLYFMRVVLAITIMLGQGAWSLLSWLPRAAWRLLTGMIAFVWATGLAVVQSLRGV